jgi:hypothetical protein
MISGTAANPTVPTSTGNAAQPTRQHAVHHAEEGKGSDKRPSKVRKRRIGQSASNSTKILHIQSPTYVHTQPSDFQQTVQKCKHIFLIPFGH